jgi:hypothetical protein
VSSLARKLGRHLLDAKVGHLFSLVDWDCSRTAAGSGQMYMIYTWP